MMGNVDKYLHVQFEQGWETLVDMKTERYNL